MPTYPPPAGPKDDMLPELCEEAGATHEQTFPRDIVSIHIQMGMYVCWNKSNTMLV